MAHDHIIIKKVKKHGHDDHHGGAWKVAFADFMIALMALFLVLWIVSVAPEEERQAIIYKLQQPTPSIFDSGGLGSIFDAPPAASPIDLEELTRVGSRHSNNKLVSSHFDGDGTGSEQDSLIPGTFETQEQLAFLAKVVEDMVAQVNAQKNVDITVTPQGLRIVLQDDYLRNMFQRGGNKLTPFFEDLLIEIAPIFAHIGNQLVISGHTDSIPFKSKNGDKSNWSLSANRADTARKTLVFGGMPEERVMQVIGMSDRSLLNPEKPSSSENRRIEIFVLTTQTAETLSMFFGNKNDSQLDEAKEAAEFNQPVVRKEIVLEPETPADGQKTTQSL